MKECPRKVYTINFGGVGMKRYRIDIDIKATETYYISANNPREALEKIRKGDYSEDEYTIDIHSTAYDSASIYEEEIS